MAVIMRLYEDVLSGEEGVHFELPPLPDAPKAFAVGDVRFEAFRAGGPGGQHQNKTESAVRAVHVSSGLAVVAREERSPRRRSRACRPAARAPSKSST